MIDLDVNDYEILNLITDYTFKYGSPTSFIRRTIINKQRNIDTSSLYLDEYMRLSICTYYDFDKITSDAKAISTTKEYEILLVDCEIESLPHQIMICFKQDPILSPSVCYVESVNNLQIHKFAKTREHFKNHDWIKKLIKPTLQYVCDQYERITLLQS